MSVREPRKTTILVVEDDVDLRETVCELLGELGCMVTGVGDGAAALEYLHQQTRLPDFILLDLMMPRMNGWQFRQAQLKDPSLAAIPVVVMTASRNLDSHPIDAEETLFKPLQLERLLKVVERHPPAPSGGDAAKP